MNANNINTDSSSFSSIVKKNPQLIFIFRAAILFVIISTTIVFLKAFDVKLPFKEPSKSQNELAGNIFIVIFFMLLVVVISIVLLPNLKEVKNLFGQITSVTYVILYTIFLILFFTMMPNDIINEYAYIITPLTAALGAFMFYKGSTQNYIEEFNVNYERIKTMIMFFCLITVFIVYYNIDPGGYIQQYFGYSLLLTIIITVFSFLYLMIILTLPDKETNPTEGVKSSNFLNNFSNFSFYGNIGFILFLIAITVTISKYPGGFFNNKAIAAAGIIIILLICITWSILLGLHSFPDGFNNDIANDKVNLFKRSLLFLFGFVISSLIIVWIVYNIQNLSGQSSIVSFVLNLLLVILILGLIYKTLNVTLPAEKSKKNGGSTQILNALFYIPYLFSGVFDSIGKFAVGEYNATSMGSILMLIVTIILLVLYFNTSSLINKLNTQGGKQLVNKPVYTDTQYSLGTYQELNGSDNINYQYGISFWIYIDSSPPSTSSSYSRYTSLLNFGGNPNILYNATTHTLMVTINQENLKENTKNKLTEFDENSNRILYKNKDILLQKWNNIIINYSGGILDIFLNGELVNSNIGVVPYYKIDNLTIGENDGIKGGICNVVYFSKALNSSNIYFLYNMVKSKTPPVLNDSNETILQQNINTTTSSIKNVI